MMERLCGITYKYVNIICLVDLNICVYIILKINKNFVNNLNVIY